MASQSEISITYTICPPRSLGSPPGGLKQAGTLAFPVSPSFTTSALTTTTTTTTTVTNTTTDSTTTATSTSSDATRAGEVGSVAGKATDTQVYYTALAAPLAAARHAIGNELTGWKDFIGKAELDKEPRKGGGKIGEGEEEEEEEEEEGEGE